MQRVEYPSTPFVFDPSPTPSLPPPRPRAWPANPTLARSKRTPQVARIEVPCGIPGCGVLVSYHPDGLRRLQANGHPPRCDSCKKQQRKQTTSQAWVRYKVKHQSPS